MRQRRGVFKSSGGLVVADLCQQAGVQCHCRWQRLQAEGWERCHGSACRQWGGSDAIAVPAGRGMGAISRQCLQAEGWK